MKENVEHCGELMQLAEELGIGSRVAFLRSISDREKVQLLKQAICVITISIRIIAGVVADKLLYPALHTSRGTFWHCTPGSNVLWHPCFGSQLWWTTGNH